MTDPRPGAPSPMGRALFLLCVVAWASWPAAPACSDQPSTALERTVKAAFLYKFGGYIDWPSSAFATPGAPFTIGVVGEDALARDLVDVVAGRLIGSRRVVVVALNETESIEGIQMMFIGQSAAPRIASLVRAAQERPVLIVTESKGALAEGSMINFLVSNARVRFEISLPATARHGLVLSSRLLAVAQSVVTRTL